MVNHQTNISQITVHDDEINVQEFTVTADLAGFQGINFIQNRNDIDTSLKPKAVTTRIYDVAVVSSGSANPKTVKIRHRTVKVPELVGPGFPGDTIFINNFFTDVVKENFFVIPVANRNRVVTYDVFIAWESGLETADPDLHVATLQSPPGKWDGFVTGPAGNADLSRVILRHVSNLRTYDAFLLD